MTKTPQLGRPVGASGEETRERIIAATMRCVADVGYSRATIRRIAQIAEVTSASLYNYFPTKSDLIEAAIAARAELAMPRLREAAERPGRALDRIDAVLDESGQLMREHPELAAFEWAIRSEGGPRLYPDDSDDTGFRALRSIIADVIAGAARNGELGGQPDIDAAVAAVYALIYGLTELAATATPEVYAAGLEAAKRMIRGSLFVRTPAGRKAR